MPAEKQVSLDVTIMGREFRVSCPERDKQGLLQAVDYLDRKMREIRDAGKIIGLERIAIMAALNITHDYLNASPTAAADQEAKARLANLHGLLDRVLAPEDNLF
ncbi:MAG TPA: cell division protein ZapA [Thiobacillaceae bacterium]|nr:cell division protein ZapA [Thiobacillaceae bacterium]